MELKDQVVSLELAQKLKELGVKQESYFSWEEMLSGAYKLMPTVEGDMRCSAFTVAEFGEVMRKALICSGPEGEKFSCWRMNNKDIFFADTEANARAKMLIYLLENKLM